MFFAAEVHIGTLAAVVVFDVIDADSVIANAIAATQVGGRNSAQFGAGQDAGQDVGGIAFHVCEDAVVQMLAVRGLCHGQSGAAFFAIHVGMYEDVVPVLRFAAEDFTTVWHEFSALRAIKSIQ